MSIINCLEDYDINILEYAHLTVNTHKDSPTFKLYVPKVMTFGMGDPKTTNFVFNNNIFINDPECKPAAATSVTTQNFLTIGRHIEREFKPRADGNNILHKGNKFILRVMDKNIRDMTITDIV